MPVDHQKEIQYAITMVTGITVRLETLHQLPANDSPGMELAIRKRPSPAITSPYSRSG